MRRGALRFGYHVGVSGNPVSAVRNGVKARCETIQVFPGSPRQWRTSEVTGAQVGEFREALAASGIDPVVFHSIYLVNMAAPDDTVYARSIGSLACALSRADMLGASAVVTHTGNHKGKGEPFGLSRIAGAVIESFEKAPGESMLLLETTAGAGSSMGNSFEQFGRVFEAAGWHPRLGFCLDTCHVFAAGYDISTASGFDSVLEELERFIGLDRLRLLHLNDSKGECGSHLDRHADIGGGRIGLDAFRHIVNHEAMRGLPAIIELPYERPGGPDNLAVVRSLVEE